VSRYDLNFFLILRLGFQAYSVLFSIWFLYNTNCRINRKWGKRDLGCHKTDFKDFLWLKLVLDKENQLVIQIFGSFY
jgi:hypothetical protein